MTNYYYLEISLDFHNSENREITAAFFKKHLVQTLDELFGETAASTPLDLLKYNPKTRRAIVRVPEDRYVKLRCSLTLCGDYEGTACSYKIKKASQLLISLIGDSRDFHH